MMYRMGAGLILCDSLETWGAESMEPQVESTLEAEEQMEKVDVQEKARHFKPIAECSSENRRKQTIFSDLDGTLLRNRNSFPYYMLIAFEVGSYFRAATLIVAAPLIWLMYHVASEEAGIKVLIFIAFAGLKESSIKLGARAVLPRFYAGDVHSETMRVFSSFGQRIVLTANPRILVEAFAREYLKATDVLGTELEISKSGRATGFVKSSGLGVLVGKQKAAKLSQKMGSKIADVGVGDRQSDHDFIAMCKEGYIVPTTKVKAVPRDCLPAPLIFHDGRFVRRPTPVVAVLTLAYMPFGFLLAIIRMAFGILLPTSLAIHALRILGVKIVVKGNPPPPVHAKEGKSGVLFVCSHRTLLDPVMISFALRRQVAAVTYAISRLSEVISPIRTIPLTRTRERDSQTIKSLLAAGDLAICPEGTTCREPFLLRYSAMFAEVSNEIVPVAMSNKMTMFHGTTATGWKGMDPFFFFMDPSPTYEVTFLSQLPYQLTCAGGKTSVEVANFIQKQVASILGFECTNLTRKDKYRVLAGNDGVFAVPPRTMSMSLGVGT